MGLYVPVNLHYNEMNSFNSTSAEGGAMSQHTSSSARTNSMDQRSTSSGPATRIFGSTTTVFEYANFIYTSGKRSAEAEQFASLIWRTRQDLTEASRLYLSPTVTNFLDTWPDRKAWINKILFDIRKALNDLGCYIESARSDRDDDTSKMKRKFEYRLNHQKRLSSRQQTFATCQQSLSGAISVMQTVEQCVGLGGPVRDPIFEAPVRPWRQSDSDIVRGPYSRRSSSKNLSLSSIAGFESRDTLDGM